MREELHVPQPRLSLQSPLAVRARPAVGSATVRADETLVAARSGARVAVGVALQTLAVSPEGVGISAAGAPGGVLARGAVGRTLFAVEIGASEVASCSRLVSWYHKISVAALVACKDAIKT